LIFFYRFKQLIKRIRDLFEYALYKFTLDLLIYLLTDYIYTDIYCKLSKCIGQTPCSYEHYLVVNKITQQLQWFARLLWLRTFFCHVEQFSVRYKHMGQS